MKKVIYIAPTITTVILNNKPILTFASTLGDTNQVGSNALGKGGGMFWSDEEEEEYYDEE